MTSRQAYQGFPGEDVECRILFAFRQTGLTMHIKVILFQERLLITVGRHGPDHLYTSDRTETRKHTVRLNGSL
jgi:hypothetical protein